MAPMLAGIAVPISPHLEIGGASKIIRYRQTIVALLVALFLLVPAWEGLKMSGAPMDQGALLLYPELILKGELPYRDFETFYGPGNLYVLAGNYFLFGDTIVVERAVGLVYRLLILLAIFFLTRRWGNGIAAGCMTVVGFLFVPIGIAAQTWMGALACGLWSLWLITKTESGTRAAAGGLLAGGTLLFRPDLAPAIIFSALPLFLAMRCSVRWKYLTGAAIGLLPMAGLLIAVGWEQLFNNLILYPVFRVNSARHIPLSTVDRRLLSFFGLQLFANIVNVSTAVFAFRSELWKRDARLILGLALFAAGMTHQVLQRIDPFHVLSAGALSLGLLSLSLLILITLRFPMALLSWGVPVAVAAVVAMISLVEPYIFAAYRYEFRASLGFAPSPIVFLKHGTRSFPLGAGDSKAASALLARIEQLSRPGQKLFVGPFDLRRTNYNDTFFYHLLPQLRPATYFLEMNPLSADRSGSRLKEDVQGADWLILNRTWDSWNEPNRSAEFASDAPNAVVREQFNLVGVYANYLLFRNRSTPVSVVQF